MNLRVEYNSKLNPGPQTAGFIQDAVDKIHESGGGRLTVGPGCYSLTTLFLRSGVDLHLERGAVLQAYEKVDEYPVITSVLGEGDSSSIHLVAALDCENVAISGDGEINGQDHQFWEPVEKEEDRPFGIFNFKHRKDQKFSPSPLLHFVRCKNIKLRDFTVSSSPSWAVHLFDCDVALITGLTVMGHPYGPHTDGIGINGSRDVRIADCHVDTGDDAIIIKSTRPGMECRNVTVTNCVVASNCAGIGLGADVYGTIRDVVFSNCIVKKSMRMIQVEMWYPGQVENVLFSGITGRTIPDRGVENERPIYIDIQEQLRPKGQLGVVRHMFFRDIFCESRGRIVMTAQDGARIHGVKLDTVLVRVPEIEDPELVVARSNSLQLSNHNPATRAVRAAVVADNVEYLTLRDVEFRWPDAPEVPMHGLCCRNVKHLVDDSPELKSTHADMERGLIL